MMKKILVTCLVFAMLVGMLPMAVLAEDTTPAFTGFSLYLEDSIALSFNVAAADLTETDFTKVEFYKNDELVQTISALPEVSEELYKFRCNALRPDELSVPVTAKLFVGGEEVHTVTKRAVDYCNAVLGDVNASADLRELITGTMNYGAAAQAYTGDANTPVNSNLCDADRAKGAEAIEVSYKGAIADIPSGATVTWTEAGLLLKDSVKLQFVFTAESVEGLSVEITCGETTWTVEQSDIKNISEGTYEITFAELNPAQLRSVVTAVAKVDGVAVSGVLSYSVESYASRVKEDATASDELKALVTTLIHYGDAAAEYVAPAAEHEYDENGKCTVCTTAHYSVGNLATYVQAEDADRMTEADSTNIYNNVAKVPTVRATNANASGGYIIRMQGYNTTLPAADADPHLSFSVTPETTGTYYIWLRVYAGSNANIFAKIAAEDGDTAYIQRPIKDIQYSSTYSGSNGGTTSDFVWICLRTDKNATSAKRAYTWNAGETYELCFRSYTYSTWIDEIVIMYPFLIQQQSRPAWMQPILPI